MSQKQLEMLFSNNRYNFIVCTVGYPSDSLASCIVTARTVRYTYMVMVSLSIF